MGRLFLPKPTTPIARAQALRFHNRMKALGRDIPHFFDEDELAALYESMSAGE